MIYIVIPVFNRWAYTDACLRSLVSQDCNASFKIVVVDHGSTDGTGDNIRKHYPGIIILEGNSSMWWTAATNLGIQYALQNSADFVLALNNDTIAEPNYICSLLESVSMAPKNSLIGSSALSAETKKVIYRGEKLRWTTESTILNHKIPMSRPISGLLEVSHFPGRGLLIPVEVFNAIGIFDEKYFPHYMADYDFTLRAVAAKYKIFCSWDAQICIYPEASGANQIKEKRSMQGYRQHLFGIKGGANLPLFYRYVFRHCPTHSIPSHLIIGSLRRVLGYWL
jgi:GT2 family glycosyltransferase